MPIIEARELRRTYRVAQKVPGLLGAVRGLFRREYKEVRAVDGVSFTIEPGEMVAFLGPNGAGKTTTLKMLSGLIYPSSGSATVLGLLPGTAPTPFAGAFPSSWAKRTNSGGISLPPTAFNCTAKSIRWSYKLSSARSAN
jgi:ABC-2 type transport system ATP-binding protein